MVFFLNKLLSKLLCLTIEPNWHSKVHRVETVNLIISQNNWFISFDQILRHFAAKLNLLDEGFQIEA